MRALTAAQSALLSVAGGDRAYFTRVFVDRTGTPTWVDLSTLAGINWIKSVRWSESMDNPTSTLTVELQRSDYEMTLSPLVVNSKLNVGGVLIEPGAKVYVEVAVVAGGLVPASGDWFEVFRGKIDEVDFARNPMSFTARDQSCDLEGFIETQGVYGGTDDVQDVMQQILDDAYSNAWLIEAVTLWSPNGTGGTPFNAGDSPSWAINDYVLSKETVFDALRRLANQIGWDLRYKWQTSAGAFKLQFFEPNREVAALGTLTLTGNPSNNQTFVVNATTFTAKTGAAAGNQFHVETDPTDTCDNIVTMLNTQSEAANVIAWRVADTVQIEWKAKGTAGNAIVFTESLSNATADGGGFLGGTRAGAAVAVDYTFGPGEYYEPSQLRISRADIRNVVKVTYEDAALGRSTVTRTNAASITKYGRRYMEITEDASSQIDSVVEAHKLADAGLEDLKDPTADQAIPVRFFPWAEVGDYYTFEAAAGLYDSSQSLALLSVEHSIQTDGAAKTTLTCRGKPSAGKARWQELEGRPGVAPPVDLRADDAPTGGASAAGAGHLVITFDDPRAMSPPIKDWAYTRIHISTSGGFTPSDANLAGIAKQTRFDVGGLIPGTTYYVKLIHVDLVGNVSATSTQIEQATERVGPYHEDNDREWGPLNPNGNFGTRTKDETTTPPDAWAVGVGSWANSARGWYLDSATLLNGDRSLKWLTGTENDTEYHFDGELFPVTEGELYSINFTWRHDGTPTNKTPWMPRIEFFDEDKVTLSAGGTGLTGTLYAYSQASALSLAPNVWYHDRGWKIAPSGARYARVMLYVNNDEVPLGGDQSATILWAYVIVARALCKLDAFGNNDRSIAGATWTMPYLGGENIDNADGFTQAVAGVVEHNYDVKVAGEYVITVRGRFTASMNAGKFGMARILKNGAELVLGQPVPADNGSGVGPEPFYATIQATLAVGDDITMECRHNDSVNRSIDGSECFMHIQQLGDRKQ